MNARRWLAGAGALWAIGALGVPPALAHPDGAPATASPGASTQAGDAAEAWYDTSDSALCSSPVGCPPVTLPGRSYPANTLHVGVSGGTESSVTYLLADLSPYLGSALPAAGTMTLPLATVAGNGNSNPSAANIEACLSKAAFKDGTQGSTVPPPATDCAVHARLVYADSTFTVDLTPFLRAWSAGTPDHGIAIRPDLTGAGPTTSWQIAFNGRNLAGAAHISSTFTPAAPITAPALTPAVSPAAGAAPTLAGAGASPTTSAATSENPTGTGSGPLAATASHGFQYPEILLLPLVLAAAALWVLRLLTSDATPQRLRAR
jgi:hypothetical protein